MIKWLKEQFEAFEWLISRYKKDKKKFLVKIFVFLCVAAVCFDIYKYSRTRIQADKIYPELLSNVRELNLMIEKEKKLENIDYSKYKFLLAAYDKGFTTKNKRLDKTLNDFYTNLKKIDVLKTKMDFDIIIRQGNDILAKFNDYFGCKDYFDYIEKQQDKPRVASEETVGVRFSFRRYIKYKFH